MKTCRGCGTSYRDDETFCPNCGMKAEEPVSAGWDPYQPAQRASAPAAANYSLKWHRFLMVVMILGGVLSVISGITMITGLDYTRQGLDPEQVYRVFPGLKTWDVLYGLLTICLGIFQIYVRNQLNQFREKGPGMLRMMYILALGTQIIYRAAASSVLKVNTFDASAVGGLLSPALWMVINGAYYAKRKELFIG